MRKIETILLAGLLAEADNACIENLKKTYIEVLEETLKKAGLDCAVKPYQIGENVSPGDVLLFVSIRESENPFKVVVKYDSNVAERLSSFVKEELRRWIMLHEYSIEAVTSEKMSDEGDSAALCVEISATGAFIERKLSDSTFAIAFCGAVVSGVREYVNSN